MPPCWLPVMIGQWQRCTRSWVQRHFDLGKDISMLWNSSNFGHELSSKVCVQCTRWQLLLQQTERKHGPIESDVNNYCLDQWHCFTSRPTSCFVTIAKLAQFSVINSTCGFAAFILYLLKKPFFFWHILFSDSLGNTWAIMHWLTQRSSVDKKNCILSN